MLTPLKSIAKALEGIAIYARRALIMYCAGKAFDFALLWLALWKALPFYSLKNFSPPNTEGVTFFCKQFPETMSLHLRLRCVTILKINQSILYKKACMFL